MRNLLSANFSRLRQSKVFYLMAGAILVLAVFLMAANDQIVQRATDYQYHMEDFYYDAGAYMGIFFAAFVSLFVGTEYSDGALRNKLIVGHTRTAVYLSNLVVCALGAVIFTAAWMLGGLVEIRNIGFSIGAKSVALTILISLLAAVALGAIFLLVSMLSTNKAISVVICIFLSLLLIVLASFFYNRLCEPEMISGVTITAEDGLVFGDPEPNPVYVSGTLRTVYTTIVNALPTGQMILLANITSANEEAIANYPLQIVSSILLVIIIAAIGVAIFRRKDLK